MAPVLIETMLAGSTLHQHRGLVVTRCLLLICNYAHKQIRYNSHGVSHITSASAAMYINENDSLSAPKYW